jgi:hypothetical protein
MDPATLNVAIDLMHFPTQVRRLRSLPLPEGVLSLLRIVAGDEEFLIQAVQSSGRSREVVREAAAFFVEQILLFQGADSYRVLGASREATNRELRRNMTLLLRWLHPDLDPRGERSVFTARVARAWNDLKTQERRAGYDQKRRTTESLLLKKHSRRVNSKGRSGNRIPVKGAYRGNGAPALLFSRRRDSSKGFLRWVLFLLLRRTAN